jgi:PAS domain S-box-containing protein
MGGYFVDCNKIFCNVTGYTKEQICGMTIFNLIAEPELPNALDQITGLIMSSVTDSECDQNKSVLIRASPKIRENLGFSVGIVRYAKVVPKGFCINLVNYANNTPVQNAQVK